ncbi:peptidase, partial [Pantoea ananatis]
MTCDSCCHRPIVGRSLIRLSLFTFLAENDVRFVPDADISDHWSATAEQQHYMPCMSVNIRTLLMILGKTDMPQI